MGHRRFLVRLALFNRREALKLGTTSLAGAALLPGCDLLELPPLALPDSIPDISTNADFYVQSAFGTPEIDPESHQLVLRNLGEEVGRIDLAILEGLEPRDIEHTLQCIGSHPGLLFIDNAIWSGLPFREILDSLDIEPEPSAIEMKFQCADGYSTAIPAEDLNGPTDDPETRGLWLVWRMNGESLPADHGAPFRFLTPGRYGTKNPKWPVELDWITEPYLGHWERSGWSNDASYRTCGFVLSPPHMAEVEEGTVEFLGTAFSGEVAINSVEVTTDGGENWESATITYSPGPHIWTLWSYSWTPPGPGQYSLQVRVAAADGTMSHPSPQGSDRLAGYDGGMEIVIEVV